MKVTSLVAVSSPGKVLPSAPAPSGTSRPGAVESFGEYLKESLALLNQQQLAVEEAAVGLARGDGADLHEIMLAAEKASLSLELAIQIRNKALEAYQEIMRMPV
ncbi:MAG: flagellar hook-basal body complex protein FliE [bacterium]|nr:flagellar hook-basal body complex protein FliE [bacterium]